MANFPIMDLSGEGDSIDWSQPQPPGVQRCAHGWDDYGCVRRGIHDESDGAGTEMYCTPCATLRARYHIANSIDALCETQDKIRGQLADVVDAIDRVGNYMHDLAWYALPWSFRVRVKIRAWWNRNRRHTSPVQEDVPIDEDGTVG